MNLRNIHSPKTQQLVIVSLLSNHISSLIVCFFRYQHLKETMQFSLYDNIYSYEIYFRSFKHGFNMSFSKECYFSFSVRIWNFN